MTLFLTKFTATFTKMSSETASSNSVYINGYPSEAYCGMMKLDCGLSRNPIQDDNWFFANENEELL